MTADPNVRELTIRCLYEIGSRLELAFTPEGSHCVIPIEVDVVKSFRPFTVSQCLLVSIVTQSPFLPSQFVVKLVDPRFSEQSQNQRLSVNGWTKTCDTAFKAGLLKIRRGIWNNYWRALGARRDIKYMWRDEVLEEKRSESELARWMCMLEVDRWVSYRSCLTTETEAYSRLRKLQGSNIPHLYGTCQHIIEDVSMDLDPLIATAPGLVIEYIEGTSLEELLRKQVLSEEDGERVAQGALTVARKIRDSLVTHEDLVARNIMVRRDDFDHPVVIDFGSAWFGRGRNAVCDIVDLDDWILSVGLSDEPARLRRLLAFLDIHNPSPVPESAHDPHHLEELEEWGYGIENDYIEHLRSDWRNKNYERILDVPPDVKKVLPNGEAYVWKYSKWSIRPNAKTENAVADYHWGRKEHGCVPPWSWSK